MLVSGGAPCDNFVLREQAQWEFWEKEARGDGHCAEGCVGGAGCTLTGAGGIPLAGAQENADSFP